MENTKIFPNGFSSWQETHFEIAGMIMLEYNKDVTTGAIKDAYESHGKGAMYELAEQWTDAFELLNKDREWDGEFYDEIEGFFNYKNR